MTRRRLFVPPERLAGSSLLVTGGDHRYLARVLRVRPGQEVTLFDGTGGEVLARVGRVAAAETELVLGERRSPAVSERASPTVPLVLLAAVPRGGRMDILVQKTSELGVAHIVPVLTSAQRRPPGSRTAGALGEDRPRGGAAVRPRGRSGGGSANRALGSAGERAPPLRLALYEREHGRALAAALDSRRPRPFSSVPRVVFPRPR